MLQPDHLPAVEFIPDQLELACLYEGIEVAIKDPRFGRAMHAERVFQQLSVRSGIYLTQAEARQALQDDLATSLEVHSIDPSDFTEALLQPRDSYLSIIGKLTKPGVNYALTRYVALERTVGHDQPAYSLSRLSLGMEFLNFMQELSTNPDDDRENDQLEDQYFDDLRQVSPHDLRLVRRVHAVLTR